MLFKSFGKKPHGKDLETITQSPLYKNGAFTNKYPTSMMREDISMTKVSFAFFKKPKNVQPSSPIPSIKTNLNTLPAGKSSIVWFGHSSYLIKSDDKHFLVDPVFSGYASPFSFSVKSFKGSDAYGADDMPTIDGLILTHDHYDHLDYKTLLKLKPKVKHIYTSLGVASHLKYWGFDQEMITEFEWGTSRTIENEIEITAVPARHFSGRGFVRAKTLWAAYILKTKSHKFFIGADSGYGDHFKEIGIEYGPFDIAMLESGQYNDWWPQIHMKPEETVQASIDLGAEVLFPVHWAKFALAFHPWNEPIERILPEAARQNVKITTPMIGQHIVISEELASEPWWRNIN